MAILRRLVLMTQQWFAFERKLKDRAVIVICSFVAQKIR